jgi:DNA-binding NarL/FixJ family response regulator
LQSAAKAKSAVIFNPYPLVLRAVETLLRKAGLTVAGTATQPEQALSLLAERKPDLFVAALSTPAGSMDGVELLRRAREVLPVVKLIGLGDESSDDRVEEAFAAGASAFVGTTAGHADIAFAVRQTYQPSIHLAPARGGGLRPATQPGVPLLTDREKEILGLVAEGHSNSELASMLGLALQTVKYHLSNVYRKLNVTNRTQAVRQAQLLKLLPQASGPSRSEGSPGGPGAASAGSRSVRSVG